MAAEVIDLLQDLGLPPPQSRERLIFPLQMENKLPFKHEEMTGRARGRVAATRGDGADAEKLGFVAQKKTTFACD